MFLILLESKSEEIDIEEKKECFFDGGKAENFGHFTSEISRTFSTLEIENYGKEFLENEMNNLNINPKKRRLDCSYDRFQIKKIH